MLTVAARLLCLILLTASPALRVYADSPPQRIVSLNLCADQYLLELADPAQVAALTHNARNPALSFGADKAMGWPVSDGNGEELMVLRPDLVIASRIRRPEIRAFLETQKIPVLEIEPVHTFEDIRVQTKLIATAIGVPEKGAQMIAQMERRLAAAKASTPADKPTAAHYQRRGYLSGQATLMSEIMIWAGLENIAGRMGARRTQHVSMEVLVAAQPEILVSGTPTPGENDIGKEVLNHPALTSLYAKARWIEIPEALTVCGGPSFPAAVETMQAQMKALEAEPR
ncbi:MAG: ABC transporter substrate-binding protein [Hyphomonas sp.]